MNCGEIGKELQSKKDVQQGKEIREQIVQLEKENDEVSAEMHSEGIKLPNLSHSEVPLDKEQIIKEVGKKKRIFLHIPRLFILGPQTGSSRF